MKGNKKMKKKLITWEKATEIAANRSGITSNSIEIVCGLRKENIPWGKVVNVKSRDYSFYIVKGKNDLGMTTNFTLPAWAFEYD